MAETTISPSIPAGLILVLDQIERAINRAEYGEALALLTVARARAELAAKNERSTRPIDVINDVGCLVEQLLGIADLLTCSPAEDLAERTLAKVGYAIEGILERAQDRLSEAREVDHG